MRSTSPEDPRGGWRAPGVEPAASPVLDGVLSRLEEALDELAELALTPLSAGDVTRLVDATIEVSSRATRQVCRAAAEADRRRLRDEVGARHTHHWLARRSRLTTAAAARLVRLGRALEEGLHAPIGEALAGGGLRVDQAAEIVAAVEAIPRRVVTADGEVHEIDREVRAQARDHLLSAAAEHDAKGLRRLGKHILDVVAPEVGWALERSILEREEQRAAAKTYLTLFDDGRGQTHGAFTIPSHQGAMFRLALHAIANPARHDRADLADPETGEWRPTPERLGQAFGDYIERFPADKLPRTAGVNATVVVTLDLDTLMSGVGTATLGNGEKITAGVARRLACEAGIIPMVLGGKSMPLDVGRQKRYHTRYQRLALAVRDQGCTAQGCEMSPDGCHAHHDLEWVADHGPTSVEAGRLLCPHHHRRAHDSRYAMRIHADNKVSFHRRT